MKKVSFFTDGGCRNNPGIGAWACILEYQQKEKFHQKELSGSEKMTTNNRMELTAVIEGIEALNSACQITIISDSKYVCDGISKWLIGWQKNNWKTANKKEVINKDLWQTYLKISQKHQIQCQWVKGHSGHPLNERADQLVNLAMDKIENE